MDLMDEWCRQVLGENLTSSAKKVDKMDVSTTQNLQVHSLNRNYISQKLKGHAFT